MVQGPFPGPPSLLFLDDENVSGSTWLRFIVLSELHCDGTLEAVGGPSHGLCSRSLCIHLGQCIVLLGFCAGFELGLGVQRWAKVGHSKDGPVQWQKVTPKG